MKQEDTYDIGDSAGAEDVWAVREAGAMRTFEELQCWQAARALRRHVADICRKLPHDEQFRLKDQLLRAGRSGTANIAEAYGRYHFRETIQFCRTARGSIYEVLDHFITGVDERLITEADLVACRVLIERAVMLLNGYIRYVRKTMATDDE